MTCSKRNTEINGTTWLTEGSIRRENLDYDLERGKDSIALPVSGDGSALRGAFLKFLGWGYSDWLSFPRGSGARVWRRIGKRELDG